MWMADLLTFVTPVFLYSFLSLVTDIVGLLVPHIFCCYQLKSKGQGLHF